MRLAIRASVAACFVLVVGASGAHHSPVNFDLGITDFSVTGKVASVSFRNPHSVIELQVESPDGTATQWHVEFSSINLLVRRGWDLDRIQAGDTVTCVGNPSNSGDPEMYMWTIRLEDGTEFGR